MSVAVRVECDEPGCQRHCVADVQSGVYELVDLSPHSTTAVGPVYTLELFDALPPGWGVEGQMESFRV